MVLDIPMEGADSLNHRLYPDLYYAAISAARQNKELGPEGRYLMTDVQTTVPRKIIDEQCNLPLRTKPMGGGLVQEGMRELGVEYDPEEDEENRRKRRRF